MCVKLQSLIQSHNYDKRMAVSLLQSREYRHIVAVVKALLKAFLEMRRSVTTLIGKKSFKKIIGTNIERNN